MNALEEMIIRTMSPETVPHKVSLLGIVLGKAENARKTAILLTTAIANLVGHIPAERWKEMVEEPITPCGDPDCSCHLVAQELIKNLVPARKMWEEAMNSVKEEGLSE